MFKPYFFITKINLMKKTMFFMVVFFFMGIASINAQYVGQAEAILILKGDNNYS